MKKAYLGISQSKRADFDQEIAILKECLEEQKMSLFSFVDVYHFKLGEETEMMQKAFEEIDDSDLMIVELTNKAIGVGVEVGYAVSQQIPILYLKKQKAPYSTTVGGCATQLVEYESQMDLAKKLRQVIPLFYK